jgi:hypothetical protein
MVIVLAVVRGTTRRSAYRSIFMFSFANFVGHARAATLHSCPAGKSSTWRAALCALPVDD